ncbi:hypothetical protein SUGI_0126980 [Cryptomeria japonica]|nr:hypothetical protein SUGI_0126980 [Cryptomeria japonica]
MLMNRKKTWELNTLLKIANLGIICNILVACRVYNEHSDIHLHSDLQKIVLLPYASCAV